MIIMLILMVIAILIVGSIHWALGVVTLLAMLSGVAVGMLIEAKYGNKIEEWLRK